MDQLKDNARLQRPSREHLLHLLQLHLLLLQVVLPSSPPLLSICLQIMVHMLARAQDRITKIALLKLLQPAQLQPALTVRQDQLLRLV